MRFGLLKAPLEKELKSLRSGVSDLGGMKGSGLYGVEFSTLDLVFTVRQDGVCGVFPDDRRVSMHIQREHLHKLPSTFPIPGPETLL